LEYLLKDFDLLAESCYFNRAKGKGENERYVMNLKAMVTGIVSAILLITSLIVHLLIFEGNSKLPGFIDISLTIGMVLAWLLSSKFIKELNRAQPDVHPIKLMTQNAPRWLVLLTGFFMFYAVINMGMMIRTRWQGSHIRGVSGFWLFFYSLSIMISWARWRQSKQLSESTER